MAKLKATCGSGGFTLIEILIVMAVLAMIALTGLTATRGSRQKVDQDNAKTLVLGALEEARSRALAGFVKTGTTGLYNHGVHLESDKVTTFQTLVADDCTTTSGETSLLPLPITYSASATCTNIVFSRLTGKTNLSKPETISLSGNTFVTIKPDGTIIKQ